MSLYLVRPKTYKHTHIYIYIYIYTYLVPLLRRVAAALYATRAARVGLPALEAEVGCEVGQHHVLHNLGGGRPLRTVALHERGEGLSLVGPALERHGLLAVEHGEDHCL